MDYLVRDINEKALYILKVDTEGKVFTEFYALDTSIIERVDLDEYNKKIEDSKRENRKTSYEVKKNVTLELLKKTKENYPTIFNYRDHVSKMAMRSAYCEFHNIGSIDNIEFGECDRLNSEFRIKDGHGINTYVSWFIKDLFDSYMLEQAYKKCSLDKSILCNSHRKVGINTIHIHLNNLLSAEIETNFSYGNSSYFTMTLYYKEVKIVPYSKIIYYQFAKLKEVLNCTNVYNVCDDSWRYSLDFIRDASNEFHENGENSFITKYINNECEALCLKLPEILKSNTFKFYKDSYIPIEDDIYEEVILKGFDLINFRAKVIVGAIGFISQLNELSNIIPIEKYRKCIYNSCLEIQPIINEAIIQLEKLIILMNNEEVVLTDICEKIDEQSKVHKNEIKTNEEKLEQLKSKGESSDMLVEFFDHYTENFNSMSEPQIEVLKNSWHEIITLRNEVSRKSSSYESIFKTLEDFSSAIVDYISDNKVNT